MLIGITGYARSGKDTVCRLIQEFEPESKRYAFADALKAEVARASGTTVTDIEANKAQYRELLQNWGIARRGENSEYWVEQVARKIEHEQPRYAIITDVRFKNELEWLRANGGYLVRVVRPGVGAVNGHISEHDLEDVIADFTIHNNGTLDDLRQAVAVLCVKP